VKLSRKTRGFVLGAIISALLTTLSAAGLSMCIGPGSHIALEAAGAGCCLLNDIHPAPGMSRVARDCGACEDLPLSFGVGLTTHAAPSAFVSAALAALPLPLIFPPPMCHRLANLAAPRHQPAWNHQNSLTLRC